MFTKQTLFNSALFRTCRLVYNEGSPIFSRAIKNHPPAISIFFVLVYDDIFELSGTVAIRNLHALLLHCSELLSGSATPVITTTIRCRALDFCARPLEDNRYSCLFSLVYSDAIIDFCLFAVQYKIIMNV